METAFLLFAAGAVGLFLLIVQRRRLQAERDRVHIAWAQSLRMIPGARWEGDPVSYRQQQLAMAYAGAHRPVTVDRRDAIDVLWAATYSTTS